jgi:hypothetical protein
MYSALLLHLITRSETHTLGSTPLEERSAHCRGRYVRNRQRKQETNIYTSSEFQNPDTSNCAAAQLRLRRHSHRDRRNIIFGLQ